MTSKNLIWEHLPSVGRDGIYHPETIRATVPGGWVYAFCGWDEDNDRPEASGWNVVFVPKPEEKPVYRKPMTHEI